jgi:adenine phosphoribosyltransferase
VTVDIEWLESLVRDVEDFPEPGIMFKDLTPLLANAVALRTVVDAFVAQAGHGQVDQVVGIEARGFLLAAPIAYHLDAGFVPARKAGKLPSETASVTYDLEYGTATLELHRDAFGPGDRVLIVDDVLATGGTARATVDLVEELGAEVIGCHFLLELGFLDGRAALDGVPLWSLLHA